MIFSTSQIFQKIFASSQIFAGLPAHDVWGCWREARNSFSNSAAEFLLGESKQQRIHLTTIQINQQINGLGRDHNRNQTRGKSGRTIGMSGNRPKVASAKERRRQKTLQYEKHRLLNSPSNTN